MFELFEWLGYASWWFAKIYVRAVFFVLVGLMVITILSGV